MSDLNKLIQERLEILKPINQNISTDLLEIFVIFSGVFEYNDLCDYPEDFKRESLKVLERMKTLGLRETVKTFRNLVKTNERSGYGWLDTDFEDFNNVVNQKVF